MGAGKSSIGKALADDLGYSFYDLDEEIEREADRSVREIFEQKGEAYFRKRERYAVKTFLNKNSCVVALGGGALQDEAVVQTVKSKSVLVFIECPFSVILQRIKGDKKRPLLLNEKGNEKNVETLKSELKALYEKRLPLYKQADIIIDSSASSTPRQAAANLYEKVTERSN